MLDRVLYVLAVALALYNAIAFYPRLRAFVRAADHECCQLVAPAWRPEGKSR